MQARTHLDSARRCAFDQTCARSRAGTSNTLNNLVREMQPRPSFPIEPVGTNEEAVRGADLIVTATSSQEPVINKEWISPGAHVNAIGTTLSEFA